MQFYNMGKNGDASSRYPNTCTSCSAELCHTRWTQWRNRPMYVRVFHAADMVGFTVQWEVLAICMQGLMEACLPWDIWKWEVVCKCYNVPWGICKDLWLFSTPSYPSWHSTQVNNIRGVTQKTLWLDLNSQSVQTEDTFVEIQVNHDFKPPRLVVWKAAFTKPKGLMTLRRVAPGATTSKMPWKHICR